MYVSAKERSVAVSGPMKRQHARQGPRRSIPSRLPHPSFILPSRNRLTHTLNPATHPPPRPSVASVRQGCVASEQRQSTHQVSPNPNGNGERHSPTTKLGHKSQGQSVAVNLTAPPGPCKTVIAPPAGRPSHSRQAGRRQPGGVAKLLPSNNARSPHSRRTPEMVWSLVGSRSHVGQGRLPCLLKGPVRTCHSGGDFQENGYQKIPPVSRCQTTSPTVPVHEVTVLAEFQAENLPVHWGLISWRKGPLAGLAELHNGSDKERTRIACSKSVK
ncbi:hypothetical protein BT67DRAFT_45292 [Trichocladium antarcticum]|uniref:Uncharacterized protein n=1 Tax=Trichocladium antarcticum TaxID=1450529 RepID=A0AAN6ZBU6_9PEZI|nr:hypothetical protein BT67DRAFT_45292 [Trichocladium antarcticum]